MLLPGNSQKYFSTDNKVIDKQKEAKWYSNDLLNSLTHSRMLASTCFNVENWTNYDSYMKFSHWIKILQWSQTQGQSIIIKIHEQVNTLARWQIYSLVKKDTISAIISHFMIINKGDQ